MRLIVPTVCIALITPLGMFASAAAFCVVPLSELAQRAQDALARGGFAQLASEPVAARCGTTTGWEVLGYVAREVAEDFDVVLIATERQAAPLTLARFVEAVALAPFEILWVSLEPSREDVHEFQVKPLRVASTLYLQHIAPADVEVKFEAVEWLQRHFANRAFRRTGLHAVRAYFVSDWQVRSHPEGLQEIGMRATLVPERMGGPVSDEFVDAMKQFTEEYNAKVAAGVRTPAFEELVRQYRLNLLTGLLMTELEDEPAFAAHRDVWANLARQARQVHPPAPVQAKRLRMTAWTLHYSPIRVHLVGGVIFAAGDLRKVVSRRTHSPGASVAFEVNRLDASTVWRGTVGADTPLLPSAQAPTLAPIERVSRSGWVSNSQPRSTLSAFNFRAPLPWTSVGTNLTNAGSLHSNGWSVRSWLMPHTPIRIPQLPTLPQPTPRQPVCVGLRCY
jgi:hypothetical protein